jgi:mutator family transposase
VAAQGHYLALVNRGVKRRVEVVQVFPNDDALLRLVTAVLFELHDEWIAFPRRCLPKGSLDQLYPAGLPASAPALPNTAKTPGPRSAAPTSGIPFAQVALESAEPFLCNAVGGAVHSLPGTEHAPKADITTSNRHIVEIEAHYSNISIRTARFMDIEYRLLPALSPGAASVNVGEVDVTPATSAHLDSSTRGDRCAIFARLTHLASGAPLPLAVVRPRARLVRRHRRAYRHPMHRRACHRPAAVRREGSGSSHGGSTWHRSTAVAEDCPV